MNNFSQVRFLELVFLPPGLYPGEVQDIVDERRQAFALLTDDSKILLYFPSPSAVQAPASRHRAE